jgi:hypothetical protein
MSRLVLAAVVVLVAVAAADALRPEEKDEVVTRESAPASAQTVVRHSTAGYLAVGVFTRKRVLRHGQEYLSADAIDAAFPTADHGEPFDISHLATAPDGTLALAVYRFPAKEPVQAAIELWREGRLVGAFEVPAGSFSGGLGFAAEGDIVATLQSGGRSVLLFSRTGERLGGISATTW